MSKPKKIDEIPKEGQWVLNTFLNLTFPVEYQIYLLKQVERIPENALIEDLHWCTSQKESISRRGIGTKRLQVDRNNMV